MSCLLAATPAGVSRVTETGAMWSVERALEGHDVRCLAVERGTVFAGTADDGVFRSDDGARTWTHAGLAGERVRSIAAGRGVLYAGTQPPRVHASPDGGKSWRPLTRFPRARSWWWVQPAERPYRPSYVSALAVTPSGTIVAGIEACAVLRSDDGGRSWSGHRPGALRDCHELHVADGRVYEAGSGGVAFSDDDGRSWQRHRAGLDRRYGWSMAVAGETLYLTAARYLTAHSGNSQARIFRNRRGHAWEGCTSELGSLPRLGATADGAAFAAFSDGTLLRSPCEGQRWEPVCRELGGPSSALVAMRAEPANI